MRNSEVEQLKRTIEEIQKVSADQLNIILGAAMALQAVKPANEEG